MPIDYDKIVEGRRRNWDPLKPEEVRQQERDDERERTREEREKRTKGAGGGGGYHARRQKAKEESDQRDREKFRLAVRQSVILGSAFVIILSAYFGIERLIEARQRAALLRSMTEVQTIVDDGRVVNDLTTPINAFATWRSAWKRGDVPQIVRLFSSRFLSHATELKSMTEILGEYQRLYRDGRLQATREIAEYFDGAQVIRIPNKPWRQEELALFRSPHLQKIGDPPPGMRYIVAFSYNKNTNSWHFADVREDKYFSIKWNVEGMIKPMRIGPGAITYDDKGFPIDNRQYSRTRRNQP